MDHQQRILAYLKQNTSATSQDLASILGVTRRTVFRHLRQLLDQGKIVKTGTPPHITYTLPGSPAANLPVRPTSSEPPLVDIKVTNPLTYLKLWWKKILANEGVDLRLRIRPLTALAIALTLATLGFGLGRISLSSQKPYLQYSPPQPTPTPWRETAFAGLLQQSSNQRYYLLTADSEAITLETPQSIDLQKLVGRRIFATGSYNPQIKTLKVTDASDMELLPTKAQPLPTLPPQPEPNVACTMDAKICPDGSGVGRIPPACDFAPCPGEN